MRTIPRIQVCIPNAIFRCMFTLLMVFFLLLSLYLSFREDGCVINFPRVEPDFGMTSPYILQACRLCSAKQQRMTLSVENVSDVMVAHFSDGASPSILRECSFRTNGCTYSLRSVVQLRESHFVAWLRSEGDVLAPCKYPRSSTSILKFSLRSLSCCCSYVLVELNYWV